MLPQLEHSVFTHGDIASRNTVMEKENNITGILAWESAGWGPGSYEYAQIMRPAFGRICLSGHNGRIWQEEMVPGKSVFFIATCSSSKQKNPKCPIVDESSPIIK
jgi:hypothetical protein